MAKKSLGQHFLRNKSAIRAIVAALDPQSGETIVEIGPGHGELTAELRIANCESRIVAIEKDEELCEKLNDLKIENLTLIRDDALTALPKLIDNPQSPRSGSGRAAIRNYKIVGSIPYYITGHLLRIISELPEERKPKRCVFAVQREVAERIVAKPPRMNRLAASVAYWTDAKIVMSLARQDFTPPPKVASAIILLNRKARPAFPDANHYYAAVRALFSQPRKIILNNLIHRPEEAGRKRRPENKEKTASALRDIDILPELRPQDLAIKDIAKIAAAFF
jgi:16S rRNA (adenine1518-N6/adenine1519-N6)-dimethyltransferase